MFKFVVRASCDAFDLKGARCSHYGIFFKNWDAPFPLSLLPSITPSLYHSFPPSLLPSITPSLFPSFPPSLHHSISPVAQRLNCSGVRSPAIVWATDRPNNAPNLNPCPEKPDISHDFPLDSTINCSWGATV